MWDGVQSSQRRYPYDMGRMPVPLRIYPRDTKTSTPGLVLYLHISTRHLLTLVAAVGFLLVGQGIQQF